MTIRTILIAVILGSCVAIESTARVQCPDVQRVLESAKDAIDASGTFWLDANGAVLQSEGRTTGRISAIVKVRYARHEASGLWLPEQMEERYRLRQAAFVIDLSGRAGYDNFRQFKVDTSISVN